MKEELVLLPKPKKLVFKEGSFILTNDVKILMPPDEKHEIINAAKRLRNAAFKVTSVYLQIALSRTDSTSDKHIQFKQNSNIHQEGYKILASQKSISIEYTQAAGAFHAVSTLKQLIIEYGGIIPCMEIADYPDFEARGIMVDISRNKIPKMHTLYKIVDIMADMKFNQLQLYIEGYPFAYENYYRVWKGGTPITGEEIMDLDKYCSQSCIELVPNQNSFGHMGAWLELEEFSHLGECTEKFKGPGGRFQNPGTLNPLDKRSVEFVDTLYGSLLPYFTSRLFNVGLDEPFELGMGKSKNQCRKKGKGFVYLGFLNEIYKLTGKYNKKMMFWGDIIKEHPELIPQLPEDAVALEWSYEGDDDFDAIPEKYKNCGIQFYVCPGTSSWNSIAGRTGNMKKNLLNAAVSGKKYGASGFLITDWGDNGHWQYMPVSYPAFAYGAALSWSADDNRDVDVESYLNKYIFKDTNKVMGRFLMDLGNYYKNESDSFSNCTGTAQMLYASIDDMYYANYMHDEDFPKVKKYIEKLEKELDKACMRCEDGPLIEAEMRNAVLFIKHGADIGIFKKSNMQAPESEVYLKKLINNISVIMSRHAQLWLERNRYGGLDESLEGLRKLKKQYENLLKRKKEG